MTRYASLVALLASVACGGPEVHDPPSEPDGIRYDSLGAVLWTQRSVEYRTLTVQTYRAAVDRLDEGLADASWTAAPEQAPGFEGLPPAVIMDLDETVLDNSPYQAWLLAAGGSYDAETWTAWCEARQADAVPGAIEFVQAAVDRGVTVFFVSNRSADTEEATRDNLVALGLGFALSDERDNVLLAHEQPDWGSAKGTRRATVVADFRVVLSVGDNLGDFVDGYKVSPAEREALAEQYADAWGRRWIVLPNPQYGSWQGALFDFDWSLAPEEVDARQLGALRAWSGP